MRICQHLAAAQGQDVENSYQYDIPRDIRDFQHSVHRASRRHVTGRKILPRIAITVLESALKRIKHSQKSVNHQLEQIIKAGFVQCVVEKRKND